MEGPRASDVAPPSKPPPHGPLSWKQQLQQRQLLASQPGSGYRLPPPASPARQGKACSSLQQDSVLVRNWGSSGTGLLPSIPSPELKQDPQQTVLSPGTLLGNQPPLLGTDFRSRLEWVKTRGEQVALPITAFQDRVRVKQTQLWKSLFLVASGGGVQGATLGPEGMVPLNQGTLVPWKWYKNVLSWCFICFPRDLLSLCLLLLSGTAQGMPEKMSQLWVFLFTFCLPVALPALVPR